ncbi:MAG: cytochrome c [Saprospiraceae bacterium]|jgi:mono/diheme cytochrome c family protein|nr:cytochrome c [Saprospiraceae bacterium]MBP9193272.1 cytochrome c [Saprospiraceae bacterium]
MHSNKMNNSKYILFLALVSLLALSCQKPGGNSTGSEYMPDMAHSVAYEANTYGYYYQNRWGSEKDLYEFSTPRKPVAGTIARGYVGSTDGTSGMGNGRHFSPNGSVPYYYADTEEERARATAEIINNPYPITASGLEKGKALYNIYCGICHGEKGDGAGYLVRDDGKYPAQPANFLLDDFINSSNGRYYHSIMYGRNVMGGYSDKLSYKERWEVIHYIRSLQATSKNLVYSEKANTLNSVDVPFASIPKAAPQVAVQDTAAKKEAMPHSVEGHGEKH